VVVGRSAAEYEEAEAEAHKTEGSNKIHFKCSFGQRILSVFHMGKYTSKTIKNGMDGNVCKSQIISDADAYPWPKNES